MKQSGILTVDKRNLPFPVEPALGKRRKEKFYIGEWCAEKLFFLCALTAIFCVSVITIFIFKMGVPALMQIGIPDFILGMKWYPEANIFGILPMIIGSAYVTAGAIILGVPVGIMTAIYMSQYAPKWTFKIMHPAIELLAGIPSVVYGFFGLVVIVPLIGNTLGGKGAGNSVLAASIILGIMILPTITATAFTAMEAVPAQIRDGSYALGATKLQTIFHTILPAAKSGVFSGVILGIGRAVGETMAVILVAGNSNSIPTALTDPVKTMTANIAIEMSYSFGLHQEALFATGVVLFLTIMGLNLILHGISRRG